MSKAAGASRKLDTYMGCFGNFRMTDAVCRARCALRLRCAIERDQQDQMEIWEEVVSAEGIPTTTH
jgi:hypothetical protein